MLMKSWASLENTARLVSPPSSSTFELPAAVATSAANIWLEAASASGVATVASARLKLASALLASKDSGWVMLTSWKWQSSEPASSTAHAYRTASPTGRPVTSADGCWPMVTGRRRLPRPATRLPISYLSCWPSSVKPTAAGKREVKW